MNIYSLWLLTAVFIIATWQNLPDNIDCKFLIDKHRNEKVGKSYKNTQVSMANVQKSLKSKKPIQDSNIEQGFGSTPDNVNEQGPKRNLFSFITNTNINLWACNMIGHWFPCERSANGTVDWEFDHPCDPALHGIPKCGWKEPFFDVEDFWETYIDIEQEEIEEIEMKEQIIILIGLALSITLMVYVHSIVEWLEIFPESIWAIFIGMGLGIYLLYNEKNIGGLYARLKFDTKTFFLFLLPPIMFQAGFYLNTKIFFRNLWTINSFAIGATTIAAFVFSFIFYFGLKDTENSFAYLDSLNFGCFISAIDPVATISIFQALHVNEKVYMIVFGESTLNDAVAIALSSSVEGVQAQMKGGIEPNYPAIIGHSILYFLVFFFVSLLIGWVIAICVSFLFVRLDLGLFPWLEIGMFLQSAYFPYIVAEACGLSGILAILAGGVMMRNYTFRSLSPWGKVTIELIIEAIGYIWENFCFAYLGISIPLMISKVNAYMVFIGIVSLLASRAISVFITSLVVNIFRRERIPLSHQIVMTYGGLRGAVAFYLALNLKNDYKDQLTSMTIILIVFTVIGLGSTTNCVLRILNQWCPQDKILQEQNEEEDDVMLLNQDNIEAKSDGKSNALISRFEQFDKNYARRYLTKEYYNNPAKKKSSLLRSDAESVDGQSEDNDDGTSIASRHEDFIVGFFDRGVRGGDMSPYRANRLQFGRNKAKKKASILGFGNQGKDIQRGLQKKKTSMMAGRIERFEGPAVELPGLTTTKASRTGLPRELDDGFQSYFSPQKTNKFQKSARIDHISEAFSKDEY